MLGDDVIIDETDFLESGFFEDDAISDNLQDNISFSDDLSNGPVLDQVADEDLFSEFDVISNNIDDKVNEGYSETIIDNNGSAANAQIDTAAIDIQELDVDHQSIYNNEDTVDSNVLETNVPETNVPETASTEYGLDDLYRLLDTRLAPEQNEAEKETESQTEEENPATEKSLDDVYGLVLELVTLNEANNELSTALIEDTRVASNNNDLILSYGLAINAALLGGLAALSLIKGIF